MSMMGPDVKEFAAYLHQHPDEKWNKFHLLRDLHAQLAIENCHSKNRDTGNTLEGLANSIISKVFNSYNLEETGLKVKFNELKEIITKEVEHPYKIGLLLALAYSQKDEHDVYIRDYIDHNNEIIILSTRKIARIFFSEYIGFKERCTLIRNMFSENFDMLLASKREYIKSRIEKE